MSYRPTFAYSDFPDNNKLEGPCKILRFILRFDGLTRVLRFQANKQRHCFWEDAKLLIKMFVKFCKTEVAPMAHKALSLQG